MDGALTFIHICVDSMYMYIGKKPSGFSLHRFKMGLSLIVSLSSQLNLNGSKRPLEECTDVRNPIRDVSAYYVCIQNYVPFVPLV